jgi:hypothetical protein
VESRGCPHSYTTTRSHATIACLTWPRRPTHPERVSTNQYSRARGNRSSPARGGTNQVTEKGAEGTYLDTARPAAMATNGQGISDGRRERERYKTERVRERRRLSLEDRRRREGSGWVCVWRAKATSTTVGEPGKASPLTRDRSDSIKKEPFSPPFVDPAPNFETAKNSKAIRSGRRPVVWL